MSQNIDDKHNDVTANGKSASPTVTHNWQKYQPPYAKNYTLGYSAVSTTNNLVSQSSEILPWKTK